MQTEKAFILATSEGYMDFNNKKSNEYLFDPLFWYFLGVSQNWYRSEWKYRRAKYFEHVSQDKKGDDYFESILKK